ncbi:MAG: four helix bundle protein [Candidatus Woesebacteria bacterium]|nr:four helix bundle protein [Candidatus Woesebacteria bacterium]
MNKSVNKIKDFTDLFVWQEGHKLVLMICKITKSFPKDELYSLVDQMRRAVVSVTSNVAEGFGRQGYKEKIQFYYLAQGSLIELKNQIIIAKDVGYLVKDLYDKTIDQIITVHKLLQGLIKSSKLFLNQKS